MQKGFPMHCVYCDSQLLC